MVHIGDVRLSMLWEVSCTVSRLNNDAPASGPLLMIHRPFFRLTSGSQNLCLIDNKAAK